MSNVINIKDVKEEIGQRIIDLGASCNHMKDCLNGISSAAKYDPDVKKLEDFIKETLRVVDRKFKIRANQF